jgi:hypothetical protein
MTAARYQHTVSSGIVLIVAALVTWISFTQQPADAFLFPRLISIFFIGLAGWNFIRAVAGFAKVGQGLDMKTFTNIVPGLLVMVVYVFFAAKFLGFFSASIIAFLAIFTIYDPTPLKEVKGWVKRITVTAVFMAVIYGLFALLLKVQTPKGLLF